MGSSSAPRLTSPRFVAGMGVLTDDVRDLKDALNKAATAGTEGNLPGVMAALTVANKAAAVIDRALTLYSQKRYEEAFEYLDVDW